MDDTQLINNNEPEADTQIIDTTENQEPQHQAEQPVEKPRKSRKPLIWGCAIVGVIALGAGAWLVFGNSKDTNAAATDTDDPRFNNIATLVNDLCYNASAEASEPVYEECVPEADSVDYTYEEVAPAETELAIIECAPAECPAE